MAEVIQVLSTPGRFAGRTYRAQVAGRPDGTIWEGWIEFVATDGSDVRRTPRETTQPNRQALAYWATGLSSTYLEGAFARTVEGPRRIPTEPRAEPLFDAPGPAAVAEPVPPEHAVLDPFSVGAKGEDLLRSELSALRGWHLRNIVRAYDLADPSLNLEALSEPELIEIIVRQAVAA